MIKQKLKSQLQWITAKIDTVERDLQELPDGELTVSTVRGKFSQYYVRENTGETRRRRYLSKKHTEYARKLAQREYSEKLLKALYQQKNVIEHFLSAYRPEIFREIYLNIPLLKRQLITPSIMTDEDYIKKWYEEHPGSMNTFEITDPHETDRGEITRSKSEMYIANKLNHLGIPYVYEPILYLKGRGKICPDFIILNVRTRETLYYEHFGKMDDPDYAAKTKKKIEDYQKNGYWPGENFFFSMEGNGFSWNNKLFDDLIQRYFI